MLALSLLLLLQFVVDVAVVVVVVAVAVVVLVAAVGGGCQSEAGTFPIAGQLFYGKCSQAQAGAALHPQGLCEV